MSKKIRLWKLGRLTDNPTTTIFPTKKSIELFKLRLDQAKESNEEVFDIVWGPEISVELINADDEIVDVVDSYPLDLKVEGEVLQPYVRPDYGRIPDKLIPPTYFENEKIMIQKSYQDLINELGSDKEAEKHIAKRLRELADIVESDNYPKVFGWSDDDRSDEVLPMMSFTLTLSYPWPG